MIAKLIKVYEEIIKTSAKLSLDASFPEQKSPIALNANTSPEEVIRVLSESLLKLMDALPVLIKKSYKTHQEMLRVSAELDHESLFSVFDGIRDQIKADVAKAPKEEPAEDYYQRLYREYQGIYEQYQTIYGSSSSANNHLFSTNAKRKTPTEIINTVCDIALQQINIASLKDLSPRYFLELQKLQDDIRSSESNPQKAILLFKYAQMLCQEANFRLLFPNDAHTKFSLQTTTTWSNSSPILASYQKIYQQYVRLEKKYQAILKESDASLILDETSSKDTKVILKALVDFMKKFQLKAIMDFTGDSITAENKKSLIASYNAVLAFPDLKQSEDLSQALWDFHEQLNCALSSPQIAFVYKY